MGTTLEFSSSFHPQTDGQSEEANFNVLDLLKCYVSEHRAKWEQYLPLVEYAYNNAVHSSTGNAPFEIVEGGKKVPPILHIKDKIFEADKYVQDMDEMYKEVKIALEKTQAKQKKAADRHRRKVVFSLVITLFAFKRWEAAQCPKVKVAKIGEKKLVAEQTKYMPEIAPILACSPDLLPSREWVRAFLKDFSNLRATGFVQDRCILDNLFYLHQAIDWARTSGTPLAIILLDFEKAYDRVDWDFLEGTLDRLGFPLAWIRGVSALYRSASGSVTIGGHVGRTFQLSRSVRQGCPLAPYLFLFVAEMMSDFIRGQQPALRGLLMPMADEPDLIDQEYADDTLLFLHYSPDVLDTIRDALEIFCVASGARINWHKSYGILAGSDDIPTWGPGDFTWLGPSETCRYLGFQVGLDVTSEQQFSPVMQTMRRKLCYWSSQHLSLGGRALVANQVLLASAWYVASC
ncbi:hypothetical protein L7F22_022818 [Adiantum nelumboides]|nr:hypothetical protein [Adiantum nelumboides]